MAVSCEYFEAEFYGDFAGHNKDEVHLEGVDFDDFAKFVKAVYPPNDIDGDNIAAVMPLADRFGAKFVLGKCEHFMFDEMETTDAITILDKCGDLSDLKQQLLEDAPRSVLLELADEEMLETLSRDTMAMILKEYRRRLSQP